MTLHRRVFGSAGALRAKILATELRIRQRRKRINGAVGGMKNNVSSQIITPTSVMTAGVIGVALHRSRLLEGVRMLTFIQTADAGLRLLLMATGRKP